MKPEILQLPTPRLLAYFKKHLRNRRGIMTYNTFTTGYRTEAEYNEFMADYNAVTAELNTREHVEQPEKK
jgi:hypothetical protein